VTVHLAAVAAQRGDAPALRAVAGAVDKKPTAGRADFHALKVGREGQFNGRLQYAGKERGPRCGVSRVAEPNSPARFGQCSSGAMPGIKTDEAMEIRTHDGTAGGIAEKPVDGFAHLQDLAQRCARGTQTGSSKTAPLVDIGKTPQSIVTPVGSIAIDDRIGEIERRQAIDKMMVLPFGWSGLPERFDWVVFWFHANQQNGI
jgi:hypothetical protein